MSTHHPLLYYELKNRDSDWLICAIESIILQREEKIVQASGNWIIINDMIDRRDIYITNLFIYEKKICLDYVIQEQKCFLFDMISEQ